MRPLKSTLLHTPQPMTLDNIVDLICETCPSSWGTHDWLNFQNFRRYSISYWTEGLVSEYPGLGAQDEPYGCR
jgi:hypothetical protein